MTNFTTIQKIIHSETEMQAFAGKLAHCIKGGAVIYMHGDLGAGKTTFTRGLLQGFDYHGKVKSPTYALVEPYELTHQTIYHFDLYRVTEPEELIHIGLLEYFTASAVCVIEWPEKGFPVLPAQDLNCYIEFREDGRELILKANSVRGEAILQQLSTLS